MKLWRITRPGYETEDMGYDVYSGAVVAAETEDEARRIHPDGKGKPFVQHPGEKDDEWVSPDRVTVVHIGEAVPGTSAGVIFSEFRIG